MLYLENETENIGIISAVTKDGSYVIRLDNDESIKAFKAHSCLVEPMEDDSVAVYKAAQKYYIVHILERQSNDTTINSRGKLCIVSNELDVEVATHVRLQSASLTSRIDGIKSYFNELSLSGMVADIRCAMLKTFSSSNENTHVEITNRFERSFTYINDHEEVQTKSSRHLSEDNRVVQAKNIVAIAEEQVKIDGENIHLA